MRAILLIMIGLSSLVYADFSRSTAGVVTDSTTHLQWQDDYSDNGGNIKSATWTNAIDYCEELLLDDGDWRLPNLNELTSLVDDTTSGPSISSVFLNTTSYYYWSSTTVAGYTSLAWIVYFYYGVQYNYSKAYSSSVRCVRAGQ